MRLPSMKKAAFLIRSLSCSWKEVEQALRQVPGAAPTPNFGKSSRRSLLVWSLLFTPSSAASAAGGLRPPWTEVAMLSKRRMEHTGLTWLLLEVVEPPGADLAKVRLARFVHVHLLKSLCI